MFSKPSRRRTLGYKGIIMDEKAEQKQQLWQELQCVHYRQRMLNIIEEKLLEMRQIAEQVKRGNLSTRELEALNDRLDNLAVQVRAIDGESRRTEDGEILE